MRTKRRYAHELYPHPGEFEVRPLAVEIPYLYAQAIGLALDGTGWFDAPWKTDAWAKEASNSRVIHLIDAQRRALVADALLQGMTGDAAYGWAESRLDPDGGWVYDRAVHYGVPVERIKPYPCGPEPDRHDHMASTGDVMGSGIVTRVPGKESECPTCCEPGADPAPQQQLLERSDDG